MSWQQAALALRRLRYRRQVRGTALERCWHEWQAGPRRDWREQEFLAVDAEMSSLDPQEGELLSLGWVAIEDAAIPLASGEHHLLQPERSVGQSATIHHLRDCEFEEALSPREVAERFLCAASGRTLVFHNAQLDLAFLDLACEHLYGAPLLLPFADTMAIEHRQMQRRQMAIKAGDLRLGACRERYNLPVYPAHNALVDALATAELLLAQLERGVAL